MIKPKKYKNIIARRSGMDNSPGVQIQTSLIDMDDAETFTTSNQTEKNQQKRFRCGSLEDLRVTSNDCSMGLAIKNDKKLALGMEIYQS